MNNIQDIKPKAGPRSGTICVVDDDINTIDLLIAFLKPKGYQVITYTNAEKVLEDLDSGALKCDCIVSDLMLPELSGIELTKKIMERGIETPLILITSTHSVETALEATKSGAYDFVVKPLHLAQLLISIERALHFKDIKNENSFLRTAVQMQDGPKVNGVIGKSPAFAKVMHLVGRIAKSNSNILITGESGTGKEVVARTIHQLSTRRKGPFIAINCSAIPENLLESELFGHAKGSFTGASDKKVGLFEEAEGGTLFLDEIGDLSLPLQAKLLRVLQDRKLKRVGENMTRDIDIRIVSATHRPLREAVHENLFREDLFFRLNVIEVQLPPLRDRKEDIIPLAEFFLKKYCALNGVRPLTFSRPALDKIQAYAWPGNVRELENAVERSVVLCASDNISAEDLPDLEIYRPSEGSTQYQDNSGFRIDSDKVVSVDELVKRYIRFVLEKNHGARDMTARQLDIDRKTLYRKIQEMNVQ